MESDREREMDGERGEGERGEGERGEGEVFLCTQEGMESHQYKLHYYLI